MWNRLNVAGLRQRWASHERDPGRLARSHSNRYVPREPSEGDPIAQLKQAFMAREAIIDCPELDCRGLLVTGRREFEASEDVESRVQLRCTRNPEEHEFSFTIDRYDDDEIQRLNASWSRGERPLCTRCRTALVPVRTIGNGDKSQPSDRLRVHRCVWCGARWAPPAERELTAGALAGAGASQQGAGRHEG